MAKNITGALKVPAVHAYETMEILNHNFVYEITSGASKDPELYEFIINLDDLFHDHFPPLLLHAGIAYELTGEFYYRGHQFDERGDPFELFIGGPKLPWKTQVDYGKLYLLQKLLTES